MYHAFRVQADHADGLKKIIFNLLANAEDPDRAVQIIRISQDEGYFENEGEMKSLLRAAGAFAKDNDSYFIRNYRRIKPQDAGREHLITDSLPSANYLLSFPVPTESRMRVAYSFVQGLFLKYLFQEYKVIPLNVQEGWAELVAQGDLPEEKRLWTDFLRSELAIATIGTAAALQLVKRNIGKQSIEEEFLSSAYVVGLAQAIVGKPEIFQWQAGGQLHSFLRRDLDQIFKEVPFLLATNERRKELKKKGLERNTLAAYSWLVAHGKAIDEVEQLLSQLVNGVKEAVELLKNNSDSKTSNLKINIKLTESTEAVKAFKEHFSKEFLPVVTNEQSLDLAFGGLLGVYLLWNLANLEIPFGTHLTFMGWDLWFIKSISEQMDSPELQGTLFFMKKGEMGRGSVKIVDITGPLTAALRLVSSHDTNLDLEPPFRLYSLTNGEVGTLRSAEVGQVCTICGQPGALSKASSSVLPESKRRYYDQPRMVNQANVCSRCVQVSILTPFTTDPEVDYALVEVPVDNFLELFSLYENLEGLNAFEALKALNRVGSISVFPNRYLILSHQTSRGSLSKIVQYYLQIARQHRFLENLAENKPYLLEPSMGNLRVMCREEVELDISVALLLSAFRQLPNFRISESTQKAAVNRIISSILKGRPYDSLYAYVQFLSSEDKTNEREAFIDGIPGYDNRVIKFYEPKFAKSQGGNNMSFEDVRKLSDLLVWLIGPLAQAEHGSGNTSISGIARKYTDPIRDFRKGNAAYFLYRLAQSAESLDKRAKEKSDVATKNKSNLGYLEWRLKNAAGSDEINSSAKSENELLFEKELERYYSLYGKNERFWKSFLKEVEARTLAQLMINLGSRRK